MKNNIEYLKTIKKRLVALSLASTILGTVGCTNNNNNEKEIDNFNDSVPMIAAIPAEYYDYGKCYEWSMLDGEPIKMYYKNSILLAINKETHQVDKYLIDKSSVNGFGGKIYDLESEIMITYYDGIDTFINEDYYYYLSSHNWLVTIDDISNHKNINLEKETYSLEEIDEIAKNIQNKFKENDSVKVKVLDL